MISDLRQAILIASLGLTAAVALPHAEEIGERTAENLPYVALAGACLYGSVKFTRSMLWYEQGGVDLSQAQSKQSLRVRTAAVTEHANYRIGDIKGRRRVEEMKQSAQWMQELAIHVDRHIEPALQPVVRREMGIRKLGDPAPAEWLAALPVAEVAGVLTAGLDDGAVSDTGDRALPRINEAAFAGQIPDGVKLIECAALNDIDRYPVVMVIAGQGAGKSATMGAIFQRLDGFKAVASPKPLKQILVDGFDLVFGGDQITGKWANFGEMETEAWGDEADLSWHLHQAKNSKMRGSMLRFLWAARRESMNRQIGETEMSQSWRCFYDEASYTYNSGFNDPMDSSGKAEKAAQTFVKGVSKDAFQNFRGQRVQFYLGAQNESVDSVGLNGFSANIKDAWHLYPGLSAIEAAQKNGKLQLAQWFRRQVADGQGIALLEKNGLDFHMIGDLPTIADLKRLTDPSEPNYQWGNSTGSTPRANSAPTPEPQSDPISYFQANASASMSDDEIWAVWQQAGGNGNRSAQAIKQFRELLG